MSSTVSEVVSHLAHTQRVRGVHFSEAKRSEAPEGPLRAKGNASLVKMHLPIEGAHGDMGYDSPAHHNIYLITRAALQNGLPSEEHISNLPELVGFAIRENGVDFYMDTQAIQKNFPSYTSETLQDMLHVMAHHTQGLMASINSFPDMDSWDGTKSFFENAMGEDGQAYGLGHIDSIDREHGTVTVSFSLKRPLNPAERAGLTGMLKQAAQMVPETGPQRFRRDGSSEITVTEEKADFPEQLLEILKNYDTAQDLLNGKAAATLLRIVHRS